jgi:hypothetical protein
MKNPKKIAETEPTQRSLAQGEGNPWLLVIVGIVVVGVAFIAFFVDVDIAAIVLAALSLILTTLRLVLRSRSPWRIRSVMFDCIIGYAFSIGLIVTMISILMLGM